MDRKETLEIAGGYLMNESLRERAKQKKFTKEDLVWESLYAEIRELGYNVSVYLQLRAYAIHTKDKRMIPIFQKYIDIFKNAKFYRHQSAYEDTIIFLGHVCDISVTEYAIAEYLKDDTEAKFRWGQILLNIKDDRYIDKYIELMNDRNNLKFGSCLILLLSKLKVYRAIPRFIELIEDIDDKEYLGLLCDILMAFGDYKLPELAPYIQPYLTNPDSYIRNKAKAAMAKIDRAIAKEKLKQEKLTQDK